MFEFRTLIECASGLGATGATVIGTADIVVDESLAERCREPRCENYGLAKSCPPYVAGPAAFRKLLENFRQAIFFKIDVPSDVLFSSESREVFQLLHEVASGIERSAVEMGFAGARAYAGGSCKAIFCDEHQGCLALSAEGQCRYPQYARPSMSGFGINVAKLFEAAGWEMNWVTHHPDSTATKMANVCGLVLIA
ncbi:MAG: hypothetical protein A2X81_16340 [Desulfobacterales bacterium GWB2_56_26]|nr:MAG: hypothetical protein A2X81_16340 [Desulfobacterales bacterium GWB2_56_26]